MFRSGNARLRRLVRQTFATRLHIWSCWASRLCFKTLPIFGAGGYNTARFRDVAVSRDSRQPGCPYRMTPTQHVGIIKLPIRLRVASGTLRSGKWDAWSTNWTPPPERAFHEAGGIGESPATPEVRTISQINGKGISANVRLMERCCYEMVLTEENSYDIDYIANFGV